MDVTMATTKTMARLVAAALLAAPLVLPVAARAQVVVVANGSPITEIDIEQRTKIMASGAHKPPTRKEVINELIDDRIKIAKSRVYGLEVGDAEVDEAFANLARRQGITPEQFAQVLDHAGITANALKAKLRAEITWQQMVRGRYNSTLQVADSDVAAALRSRGEDAKDEVGYVYTLYPVLVVMPSGSGQAIIEAKRREAENLRSRFLSCNEGLPIARASRDIAVREPITRSSSDLSPQLRDLLGKLEVGRLTTPDPTPQGLQMFALCAKKESISDSPAKREVRDQIFNKRFEAESKKFLDEIRKQAMIEYK
jgi:peptidyl-prolyl cis-trans isomerase SurA